LSQGLLSTVLCFRNSPRSSFSSTLFEALDPLSTGADPSIWRCFFLNPLFSFHVGCFPELVGLGQISPPFLGRRNLRASYHFFCFLSPMASADPPPQFVCAPIFAAHTLFFDCKSPSPPLPFAAETLHTEPFARSFPHSPETLFFSSKDPPL